MSSFKPPNAVVLAAVAVIVSCNLTSFVPSEQYISPFCLISNALCLALSAVPLPTENNVLPLSPKVVEAVELTL